MSSLGRTMTCARIPWRVPFSDERCLPSGVRGPVDFLAFSRLARRRASDGWRLPLGAGRVFGRSVCMIDVCGVCSVRRGCAGRFVGLEQVFGVVVLGHFGSFLRVQIQARCTGVSRAFSF